MDNYEKMKNLIKESSTYGIDPIHPDEPTDPTEPTLPTRFTPNYKLPLWDKNSITSWITTMNYAMTTIDFAMHKLALGTPLDGDIPQELIDSITSLEQWKEEAENRISTIESNLIALQKSVNSTIDSITQLTIKVDTNTRDIAELKGESKTNEGV